jgi:hypothetical protein
MILDNIRNIEIDTGYDEGGVFCLVCGIMKM